MAATKYGSGNYGISTEFAKGLYIADLSLDVSEEEIFLPNHIGEDIGLILFNQSATISGSGATVTADSQGQTMGGILDVASTSLYGTDTGVTKFYVNSVNLRDVNRDFQSGGFTAIGRSGITAASGSEIT